MPDPISGLAAASLIGGVMQSNAASDAADAQAGAARESSAAAIAENRRQFDLVQQLLQPYIQAGGRGLGAYESLLGTLGPDAQRTSIQQLQESPQFTSLAKTGEDAILANASATGGLRGGNTQAALAKFRPQLLSQLIDQQLTRYGQLGTVGQNSATGVGNAALGTGTNNGNLMFQSGNLAGAAQAGGTIAGANAITNAIGGVGGLFAARSFMPGGTPIVPTSSVPAFGSGPAFGNQDLGQYF